MRLSLVTGKAGYGSLEVCEMAAITYRQLDYWIRLGHLDPENAEAGSGTVRCFSPEEAEVARRIGRLVRAGLPLDFAARMARYSWPEADLTPGVRVVVRS